MSVFFINQQKSRLYSAHIRAYYYVSVPSRSSQITRLRPSMSDLPGETTHSILTEPQEIVMRRLYFILPDISSARTVVDELLLKRINSRQIHVMAREGTDLGDLPEASLFQKSDFIPAIGRGLAVGGVTGILVGVILAGFSLSGAVILGAVLAGAGIGAWVSSMIGVDVPNSQIHHFEHAINAGSILMMVDIPATRVAEIETMVYGHHPAAAAGGTEPHIPAFP
jgi:hypothetical protein